MHIWGYNTGFFLWKLVYFMKLGLTEVFNSWLIIGGFRWYKLTTIFYRCFTWLCPVRSNAAYELDAFIARGWFWRVPLSIFCLAISRLCLLALAAVNVDHVKRNNGAHRFFVKTDNFFLDIHKIGQGQNQRIIAILLVFVKFRIQTHICCLTPILSCPWLS